jgi:hypothetical protein
MDLEAVKQQVGYGVSVMLVFSQRSQELRAGGCVSCNPPPISDIHELYLIQYPSICFVSSSTYTEIPAAAKAVSGKLQRSRLFPELDFNKPNRPFGSSTMRSDT